MSKPHRTAYLVGIVSLLSALAFAQNVNPNDGIPTFSAIKSYGVDAINLQNLDILLNVTVRDKAGAFPFTYMLSGNSACDLWIASNHRFAVCGIGLTKGSPGGPNNNLSSLPGALLNGTFLYKLSYGTGPVSATCPDGSTTAKYSNWYIQEPNLTTHLFSLSDYVDRKSDGTSCLQSSFSDYTTDGSGLGANVSSPTVATLHDSGGNTAGKDPNGNTVAATFVSPNWIYTDTLGTVALSAALPAGSSGGTYQWTDINGGSPAITETLTSATIKTAFGCGIPAGDALPNTEPMLTSLNYPDGSNIQFGYEPTPGGGGYTGRLQTIVLRTGGSITYGYSGGNNGLDCNRLVPPTMTRTTQDGTTTYNWALINGGAGNTTTVIDPGNNKTVYTFAGTFLTETQVYQNTGSVSTPSYVLLSTDIICYNGASPPATCPTASVSYPITERDIYHTAGTMSTSSRTQITYDGVGNVTSVAKYDFGASSFTTKTTTAYGSWNGSQCVAVGNNINNRPCDVLTTDGTNNLVEARYTYDPHGNVLTTSKWTGSRWLNSSTTYNTNGTAATATDVNNTQTTFSYAATGSGGCNGLLLTGTSTLVSAGDTLTTSKTWDSACNGAVPVTSTDANGNVTHYTYNDPYFRPTSVTDPLTYAKTITYTSPSSVNSHASFGSSVDDVTAYMDGLGRSILTQRKEGPGSSNYDSISTTYGWNGTVFQGGGSMPCVQTSGAGCSSYFTYSSADPLGRPLSGQDAGGGTVTYTYTKNDVLQQVGPAPAGENLKSKQFEYDGLGRLTSVCEITSASGSGTCGQSTSQTGFWTRYQYDAIGRLTGVCQNTTVPFGTDCVQSPSTGQQTRRYSYDALGRLLSEQNPESGTTTYLYDSDPSGECTWPNTSYYGSIFTGTYSGDLVKKTSASGNKTCYQYDALHRLSGVIHPYGPAACARGAGVPCPSPNSYFVYDSATVNGSLMTNAKGRTAEAYTCAGACGSKLTDSGFSYDGDGRTVDFYESTPHSSGYYHITAGYWLNGALNTLNGVGLPTITYGVDGEGRPNTVSASSGGNPVSSTSYNPAGQVTDVTFGSGDPVHFGLDPNTGRMTQYKLTINGTATYGNLTWNANGTVNQLAITDPFNASDAQTCNYTHDDLARLASVDCGASHWQQNFTYDSFGNITKSVPLGGTGGSFQPGYNGATNQYTDGATYDADGNLTNDGTDHVYTWDSDGHPVTLDSDSLVYDALGREVEVFKGGAYTEFVFSPTGKLALMNGQTQTKAFVRLPGGTQVKYAGNTISTYRLPDWLGSLRVGSNPNRTYSWGLAFAPFGEMYAQSGGTAWSFTGEDGTADTVSDEYDFLARKLHASQGRWISPDPAGLEAVSMTNPQTWNRYAYVSNDPLNLTDPSGLWQRHANKAFGSPCSGTEQGGCTDFTVNGADVPGWVGSGLLGSGVAAQCPNNQCHGFNSRGQYMQYWAFANSGGYYAYSGPGALYFSLEKAGLAASNYLASQFSPDFATDMHEYASNVYEDTASDVFSYTAAQQGAECSVGKSCDESFYFGDIPDGTTLVGSAHTHPQFGYGDTEFSGEVGDHGDIPTYRSFTPQLFGFLVTSPGNRVLMFNPIAFAGWPGNNSNPICVLQGDNQGVPSCH